MKEYAIILRTNNHVVGRCLSYKKAANALACVIDSPTERAKYTIVPTINQRPANENRL
ncbi:MAG: hypothetical protein IK122_02025 [Alphaproteobacteria bacterium]|nr:hypothetical protein [Alphaproteobacteria bacterium]